VSNKIVKVVQAQVEAYNAGDIDAFAESYHDNLSLFIFPNESFCQGKAQLREQYSKRFTDRPNAKATIASRVVMGKFVIDDEIVTGIPDAHTLELGTIRALAIYEVEGTLISKAWFIYQPNSN